MARTDILTASGRYFDFLNPANSEVFVEDIAQALSLICRFGGHTRDRRMYSVAQHSVLASYLVPSMYALDALMHDAAEALLGDMVKPLKNLLADYRALEFTVEKALFERFDVRFPLPGCVKHADRVLLATEQRDVAALHHGEWESTRDVEPLPDPIIPVSSDDAYHMFMARYEDLRPNDRTRHRARPSLSAEAN